MKRRDFIAGLAGTAAWPVAAWAQQPNVPLAGFLYSGTREASEPLVVAFREGLTDEGFLEGGNVAIELRWLNHDCRLVELGSRPRARGLATRDARRFDHSSMSQTASLA